MVSCNAATLLLLLLLLQVVAFAYGAVAPTPPENHDLRIGATPKRPRKPWKSVICTGYDMKICTEVGASDKPFPPTHIATMTAHHIIPLAAITKFWDGVLLTPAYATDMKRLAKQLGTWYTADQNSLYDFNPDVAVRFGRIDSGSILHNSLVTYPGAPPTGGVPSWLEIMRGYIAYPRGLIFYGQDCTKRCDDPGSNFETSSVVIAPPGDFALYQALSTAMTTCTTTPTPVCVKAVVNDMITVMGKTHYHALDVTKWRQPAGSTKWCLTANGKQCHDTKMCGTTFFMLRAAEEDAKIKAYAKLAKVLISIELDESARYQNIKSALEEQGEDIADSALEEQGEDIVDLRTAGDCVGDDCEPFKFVRALPVDLTDDPCAS